RGPVAVEAGAGAQDLLGAVDEPDSAVPETDEVLGGGEAACPVGGADGGRVHGRAAGGVEDDHGHAQVLQLLQNGGGELRDDEDDAVGGAGAQVVEPLLGGGAAAVDRGDDGADTGRVGGVLDAADDLDGPGAVELVEDEVHESGVAAGSSSGTAALVAAFGQQGLDAFAGLGGDIGSSVYDAGDRGHADAGLVRDGADRDPPVFGFSQGSSRC